jgi:hypothetical protein
VEWRGKEMDKDRLEDGTGKRKGREKMGRT